MYAPEAKFGWQRSWVIGLALLSLAMPVAAIVFRNEPALPFADPARVSYYRQTVAALLLGIVCGVGAFVGSARLTSTSLRWLSVGLAGLGVLLSAYLLWTLIGICGAGVIVGNCNP